MSSSNVFLSYVSDSLDENTKSSIERTKPQCHETREKLLSGEIECAFCDDCSFGFSFTENSFGRVVCTNFRILFEPLAKSENTLPLRFKAFNDKWHIPLCSVHSIYYVPVKQSNQQMNKKKYLFLKSSLSSLEVISCIRLQLKDFRVATIDLRGSQNGVGLLNQILFFSRPSRLEHVSQAGAEEDWLGKLAFNDMSSWDTELKRCGNRTNDHWRVCSQFSHGARHFIASFPLYFVVPAELVQYDLDRMAQHWQLGRFPVWVWSFRSGVSLLRSSNFDVNWEAQQFNDKVSKCIARATSSMLPPHMICLNTEITPTKIATCYDRLRRSCSVDSYDAFASRDKAWLTRIHHSGWLQLINYCLSATAEALDWLVDRNCSVIIYEAYGLDVSAVVSSLVQICCDRYYRNLQGLDSLISKEWIGLGHPFAERLLGIPNGNSEAVFAPTFLLFLDCLAQLIRLYPMQFSYTQYALIALWDLSITGIVPAFCASSVADQLSSNKCGGPFPLERFFNESYSRLFISITNGAAIVVQRSSGNPLIYDVIRPPITLADIQLWNECYLRWIPPANVARGGNIFVDMAVKEVVEEVCPGSEDVMSKFGRTQLNIEKVSSAYPFSDADLTQRGYFALRDTVDTLSISSISLSASSQVQDDKHRASISVLRGIPEIGATGLLPHENKTSSTSSSYRLHLSDIFQNNSKQS